jgi:hypothetical protein
MERLQMLQCGLFVQYQEKLLEKTYSVWAFNDSEDSMIVYATPVGIPNKHGYWIYCHQFISNDPNRPVYKAFAKVEETEIRDTFNLIYYTATKPFTWEEVKKKEVFADLNFSELKANGERVTFVKVNNASFTGSSMRYKEQNFYREDHYQLSPTEILFEIYTYKNIDTPESESKKIPEIQHLKRLNPKSNAFLK